MPVTGKLYDNGVVVQDISALGIDVLVICQLNGEKILFSTRNIKKDGNIAVDGDTFGFMITREMSPRLNGKCYIEVRVFDNNDCYIGADRQNRIYFTVESNEIHRIWK